MGSQWVANGKTVVGKHQIFLDSGFNSKLPDGRALRQCRLKTPMVQWSDHINQSTISRTNGQTNGGRSSKILNSGSELELCHMVRGWVGVDSVSVKLSAVIKIANSTLYLLLLPLDIKLDLQVASC